jgi:hypothetical protein
MNSISVFLSTVFLYSAFRLVDVYSTQLCLSKLDPTLHEVNPIAVPLFGKLGFNKTMIVIWIPFAFFIGVADTFFVAPYVGIPVLWLFFGLFHLMAAANNFQLYFHVKLFGADVIEANTKQVILTLKALPRFKKFTFLLKTNLLYIFFSIYGIASLTLFSVLLTSLQISIINSIPTLLLVAPVIMIIDFVYFFPVMAFGSLIISWRRLSIDVEQINLNTNQQNLTVSVDMLERVVDEAHQKGANYVQFPFTEFAQEGETDGT